MTSRSRNASSASATKITTAKKASTTKKKTASLAGIQFSAAHVDLTTVKTDVLVIGISEGVSLAGNASLVNAADSFHLETLLQREKFDGKLGQSVLLLTPQGIAAQRLLVVGLGAAADGQVTVANFRTAVSKISDLLKQSPVASIVIAIDAEVISADEEKKAGIVAEVLGQSDYRADSLKSTQTPRPFALNHVVYAASKAQLTAASKGLVTGSALAHGIKVTRKLGDLPSNVCTPTYLANEATALAKTAKNLTVSILDEKQIKALKMGSFLSVCAGATEPAKIIVMEYQGGKKKDAPIALVGKGITFDTGGISLKPGAGMDEMKYDMCGAASVLGTFHTLVKLALPINVVGVIAATENMPSATATKPGDIVTSMSGLTIEILNTDAEGRLVLCDALTYTERFKPKAVIDIATLTGACVIALGNHATGLFSNNDDLAKALIDAGEAAGDRAWHMPLWDEYQKQLDSNFADIANIGGREAGSVTAACFLSRFTKNMNWAHLDIAGTAWRSGAAKGATGRPVSLLVNYLMDNA
jgi:leucyl aminopeptidase